MNYVNNIFVVFSAIAASLLLFSKPLRTSKVWHATVTPLASIIGSGFLVSAPLLILTTGKLAPLAMETIVFIAFALGSSLRTNIVMVEPILEGKQNGLYGIRLIEEVSRSVL